MSGSEVRSIVVAALTVLCASACSHGSERAAEGTVDVDTLPLLSLTEVQRIGSEQSPDTGFSMIANAAVDGDGRVYALDAQDLRIRVFDSTGTLVRMVGRRGEGPGELQSVPSFGVVGDTLWTVDRRADRITLFSREGAVLATASYDEVWLPLAGTKYDVLLCPNLMRPDGRFLGEMLGWHPLSTKVPGPDTAPTLPRLLFDAAGAVVDTVGWFERTPPVPSGKSVRVEGRRWSVPSAPDDQRITLLLTDGEILVDRRRAQQADTASFTAMRVGFSGDTVYRRIFRYGPVGYPSAFLDSLALRYALPPIPLGATAPPPSRRVARTIRAEMHFPEFQPPVEGTLVGADRSVWLRREDRGEDSYEWLLLDPEGRPRGRLDVPRSTRLLWTRGDELLASVPDDLGVPWLVRYRLGPSD